MRTAQSSSASPFSCCPAATSTAQGGRVGGLPPSCRATPHPRHPAPCLRESVEGAQNLTKTSTGHAPLGSRGAASRDCNNSEHTRTRLSSWHGAGFPKGGRVRARGLRKVLGGVGLLGVEPGPTAATGGRRAVERPLGLPTSVCARGRAWGRRSLLGRAGLVGSPAGRLVHGVCGGVPLVPGEGGHQAAATAGVAALPCLVLARLVKYGCCCVYA